jgi:hypothetical protein
MAISTISDDIDGLHILVSFETLPVLIAEHRNGRHTVLLGDT